jgi:hypothetical protein
MAVTGQLYLLPARHTTAYPPLFPCHTGICHDSGVDSNVLPCLVKVGNFSHNWIVCRQQGTGGGLVDRDFGPQKIFLVAVQSGEET